MQFFFVAEFSKPFGKVVAVVDNGKPAQGKHFNGRSVRAWRPILPQPTRKSCSLSWLFGRERGRCGGKTWRPKSRGFHFDRTRADAEKAWQEALGNILRPCADDRKTLETFYRPRSTTPAWRRTSSATWMGSSGRLDGRMHKSPGFTYCTTFSPRDTSAARTPALVRDPAPAHGRRRADDAGALQAHDAALPAGVGQRRQGKRA